mgnify:FL=1
MIMMAAAVVALTASCRDDDPVAEAAPAVRDAEVSVSVRFSLPQSRTGDPGSGHQEFAEGWDRLDLYFVYEDGTVLTESVAHADFMSPMKFGIYEGSVQVFAAAVPDGQDDTRAYTAAEVRGLTVTDAYNAVQGDDARKEYMLGFFSGVSSSTEIVKEQTNEINLVLNRLVAKIDMQWDVQPGITEGSFVDASMSGISFRGYATGYLFPSEAPVTAVGTVRELATIDGTVSARNGRAYFYTFPGTGCGFDFGLAFTGGTLSGRTTSYNATFNAPLEGDAWHKVNVTVRGTNVSSDASPVAITLEQ